jgi:bis(5'-nucleosyl)-tetraphosphatase (symmetrical)
VFFAVQRAFEYLMATFAIGDVQGCLAPLRELLDNLHFDLQRDRLWFVGDLVNRGPDSAATLRFVRSLGTSAVCTLGNHDLHLLAVAGGHAKVGKDDTIHDVLNAPDCEELLDWLRRRPLMHVERGYALVHAGLLPTWTIERAAELAQEVELVLRGPDYSTFLAGMYSNLPARWSEDLSGTVRWRVVINAMTRLRICTPAGEMDLTFKGEAATIPAGRLPWFDVPLRMSATTPIIFGHWSALGLVVRPDVIGLDTGCVWGRQLSAIRLEDRQLFQVSCSDVPNRGRRQ